MQLDSFYSYYRLLISEQGRNELACLLENLTINETSFFRNKAQMESISYPYLDGSAAAKKGKR